MGFSPTEDLRFMKLALDEARAAVLHDDVPVGAVLVAPDGTILSLGRNEREKLESPVAHAEVQALIKGAASLQNWNLTGYVLYVSLEPCAMCAGALVNARISEVVYATPDPKGGAISLRIPILENSALNHRVKTRQGPCAEEAAKLLQDFFRKRRKEKAETEKA